uniref:MOSC domain-containing protein n=1 Tax=Timema monikensis TaxID=170555 RepID=A0A7R9E5Z6_9NEOP|nr:unnamed protein product [Timema monikensis]
MPPYAECSISNMSPLGTGKKPALSLSNQAQFLLVNDCSIDWLKEKLEDSAEYSQESQLEFETVSSFQSNLLARFRCNLAVQGKKPFEENDWTNIQIGQVRFQSEGVCTRCQMVCIDQSTGEKTREPLHTIAASFQGKMRREEGVIDHLRGSGRLTPPSELVECRLQLIMKNRPVKCDIIEWHGPPTILAALLLMGPESFH